jgi:3D (Asp-Asp-Asp) domain-containing protein
MGDTSAQCGLNPGNSSGSGCTFGAAGQAKTVFSGSPSLALVAHELANAETENDAVPSLMNEVTTAEAGTSWSPIDAVASCLVAHFMGFQDDAAGTWQCPAALAMVVVENIHDTVVTTEMTSTCGTKSGVVSTLTFTGTAGSLTVTAPAVGAPPETVVAGAPVTVSGIGTFTAIDRGGAIDQTGECAS